VYQVRKSEMMTFNELQKIKRKGAPKGAKHLKLAVLGDSSTQLLTEMIQATGVLNEYNFDIFEAGYNQIHFQVTNPASDLHSFKPDYAILFFGLPKFTTSFYLSAPEQRPDFAGNKIEELNTLISILVEKNCKVIVTNLPEVNDGIFGNYGNKIRQSFIYQLRSYNFMLLNLALEIPNLHICDFASLSTREGHLNVRDPKFYITADIITNMKVLPSFSKSIVDIILASEGKFKKCVILDLDNTLWGGVIGDDGIDKIHLGDLGSGKAFSEFQRWLKELYYRGIILAVCSKNDESNAKEPFLHHSDMILKLENIAVFLANWENKADNIKHIQKVLNIGFDSMVFIDDNPAERDIVRMHIPEIEVPELPEDPALYLDYLQGLNLFETSSFSENDFERTKQYQVEAKRVYAQKDFVDIDAYLASLQMECKVESFNSYNIPRVTQLLQRSNQFNLRTIRYSEQEIRNIMSSEEYMGLTFSLKDKFGDNGLVSVVIIKKSSDDFFIENWVMSCRVLKRGLEQFIMKIVCEQAVEQQLGLVRGEYIPTKKNGMVARLYENLNFNFEGKYWVLNTRDNVNYNHKIKSV
jgi:FkbH-like protein